MRTLTTPRLNPDVHAAYERQSSLVELGRMMRAERERYGLTHDQFAKALGIRAADIVQLERGHRSPM
ncbi:helix-turn-helix domain-containing protein [Cupriavidus plantarum]|uniref:helix-turn-helix domain-containing protein n=1 Tax=Cupriavidus plantarum TaxID=942865 RepID=UPI000EAC4231|nr:helix-turn-helix transcriptional regulator [Cupriavidus plantarum]RLK45194.1 helix-turn-helix protein [Cupriavidus plantarum]